MHVLKAIGIKVQVKEDSDMKQWFGASSHFCSLFLHSLQFPLQAVCARDCLLNGKEDHPSLPLK